MKEQIERARALHQQRDHDAAATLYRGILEAHPGSAEAHYRYGNLLKDQGALEQALVHYDQAIALKSDYAHAWCNRAVVLGFMQRLPDALTSYDRAIEIDPADAIAHCNRAMVLIALGNKDAALAGFDAAIACDARNFAAHSGRGGLLQERKQWTTALAAYDTAIALNPGDAATHYNRGTVLKELEQFTAALRSYEQATALNAGFARAHSMRGVLLQKMGHFEEAGAAYDQAIAADPNDAEAWFNRGTLLSERDDPEAALSSYDRAIATRPNFADAYVNRGVAQEQLGQFQAARASYEQSIAIRHDLPESHFNLAMVALTLGDYPTGWTEYEWRWRAKGGPIFREKRDFAQPLWLGRDDIAGQTVLLYGEQGLGDSLLFCRYVELVAQLGPRILLEVPPPLVKLCTTLPGVEQVIPYGSPLPDFDLQCPLMSLPLAFKTALETIPAKVGYLRSDASKVDDWRRRLGPKVRPRIGLTWSGQTAGTNRKRHFALSSLLPFLPADVDYFCLQTDVAAADQQTLSMTPGIRQFKDSLRDFTDTAALCECMDLLISVDTSVAHLGGALGKKTWVLLAFSADWRWLTDRDDSPWYPTMRLFRQRSLGDWHGVFERVSAELRQELR